MFDNAQSLYFGLVPSLVQLYLERMQTAPYQRSRCYKPEKWYVKENGTSLWLKARLKSCDTCDGGQKTLSIKQIILGFQRILKLKELNQETRKKCPKPFNIFFPF